MIPKNPSFTLKKSKAKRFFLARWRGYLRWAYRNAYLADELKFADRLACIVQSHMKEGKSFDETIEASIRAADPELISGVMLDKVVVILSKVWQHGGKFLHWFKTEAGQAFKKSLNTTPGPGYPRLPA